MLLRDPTSLSATDMEEENEWRYEEGEDDKAVDNKN